VRRQETKLQWWCIDLLPTCRTIRHDFTLGVNSARTAEVEARREEEAQTQGISPEEGPAEVEAAEAGLSCQCSFSLNGTLRCSDRF